VGRDITNLFEECYPRGGVPYAVLVSFFLQGPKQTIDPSV
jgi:hypothetical protein